MDYAQAREQYYFDYAKNSYLRTFTYYVFPCILVYTFLDLFYVSPAYRTVGLLLRLFLCASALCTVYYVHKSRRLDQIILGVYLTIISFAIGVNLVIYIGNLSPAYCVGVALIAIGGFGMYPLKPLPFIIMTFAIFAPSFILISNNFGLFISRADSLYYFIFVIALSYMLFMQTKNVRNRLHEEFQSKWLLASHILRQNISGIPTSANDSNVSQASKIARQIAHDLRSPLSALSLITKSSDALPDDKKQLISLVGNRIEEITSDLEKIYKVDSATHSNKFNLNESIEKIIIEKNILTTRSYSNFNISNDLAATKNTFVTGNESYFLRIVSNIINNSIEASGKKIQISIQTAIIDNMVKIIIDDKGKGIPAEILPLIGTEGFTANKKDGRGIGLYDAKQKLKSWGGELSIQSTQDKGTLVQITLPVV